MQSGWKNAAGRSYPTLMGQTYSIREGRIMRWASGIRVPILEDRGSSYGELDLEGA